MDFKGKIWIDIDSRRSIEVFVDVFDQDWAVVNVEFERDAKLQL
jgi:hypothetical protein